MPSEIQNFRAAQYTIKDVEAVRVHGMCGMVQISVGERKRKGRGDKIGDQIFEKDSEKSFPLRSFLCCLPLCSGHHINLEN